jgi:hypothetical protein
MGGDRLKKVRKLAERERYLYIGIYLHIEALLESFKGLKEEMRGYLDLPPRSSSIKKRRTHPLIHARFFLRLVLSG